MNDSHPQALQKRLLLAISELHSGNHEEGERIVAAIVPEIERWRECEIRAARSRLRSSERMTDALMGSKRDWEAALAEAARLREIIAWCRERLPPAVEPMIDQMLAGDGPPGQFVP